MKSTLCSVLLLMMVGCWKSAPKIKPNDRAAEVTWNSPVIVTPPVDYLKLLRAKAKEKNVGWEIYCNTASDTEEYIGWAWAAGHHHVYIEQGGTYTWWVYRQPSQEAAVRALYERLSDDQPPDELHAKKHLQCKPPLTGGPQ